MGLELLRSWVWLTPHTLCICSLSPVANGFSYSEGQRDTAQESPVLTSPCSCPRHGGLRSPTVLLTVPPPDLYQSVAETAVASCVLVVMTSCQIP